MVAQFIRTYIVVVLFSLSMGYSSHCAAQTYHVEPIKIGKPTDEIFAGDFYNNKLFFCSNAKAKKAKNVVNEDDSRFLNLYQISFKEDFEVNKKEKPAILSENINSDLNEGPIFFNKKSGEAFFSSNYKTDSSAISLVLYSSLYDKNSNTFSQRERIVIDLGDGNYSNPTISPDGSMLIFSFTGITDTTSNLYLSERNGKNWEKPHKLDAICTDYSESFPRWFENTLYFVSTRPGGMGGLDIYSSTYYNGEFSAPRLLPEPINSKYDDFLFFHVTNTTGFFSSNRGQGNDRVYKFNLDIPTTSNFVESDINFCYTMQDETILDGKEYDYIWEFGDGAKQNGAVVNHCYKDSGVYELSCHLLNIETLEVENDIINATIEVVAKYPIIESTTSANGKLEISLNQKWSRNTFDNYYWIVNNQIISDASFEINVSDSKPIEIKAVLWDTKKPGDIIGLKKTITDIE